MANTLASLFNSKKGEIYSKFSNRDILVEIKPDTNASRSRIKDDSRLLPTISVQRDISRISKFLKSDKGLLFVGKQQLLQTGNAFAETRLYNPLEVLINVPPAPLGRHFPRHLGKPSIDIKKPTRKGRGALQKETLEGFGSSVGNIFNQIGRQALNTIMSPVQALLVKPKLTNYFGDDRLEFYVRPEDNTDWRPRLISSQPLSDRGTKRKITNSDYIKGEELLSSLKYRPISPIGYSSQLQVYKSIIVQGSQVYDYTDPYMGYIQGKNTLVLGAAGSKGSKFINPSAASTANIDTKLSSVYTTHNIDNTNFYTEYQAYKGQINTKTIPKYRKPAFSYLESTNFTNGYFYGPSFKLSPQQDGTPVKYDEADIAVINANGNITDPYNDPTPFVPTQVVPELQKGNVDYSTIQKEQENKSDIIKFIFKDTTTNATPVHFRAFISTIKQNIKPEFNEQRYVGRTERFVTYAGAKRSVTMTFNIVAFSPVELDAMWLRINYLTGLAFPKATSPSGFMVPPLFKITIGGLYDDQPCYIENMDFDFLDETTTFDIDREVSQAIKVNISLILLEKRSRFYNSPFYGISEEISQEKLSAYNALSTFAAPIVEVPDTIAAFNQQADQNWSSFLKNQLNSNDFSTQPWSADQFNQWYRREQEYLERGQERADTVNRAANVLNAQRQAELNKIYEENTKGILSGEIPPVDEFCQNEANYEACVNYYKETFKINKIEYLKAALEAGTEQIRAGDFVPSMREANRQASIYSRQLSNTRL